jgi:hypothetical protein
MEPADRPLNIQTVIEAQGLHIAVLEARIAGCQALRSTIDTQSPLRRPRRRALPGISRAPHARPGLIRQARVDSSEQFSEDASAPTEGIQA